MKIFKLKNKNQKGFTLIEAMVSMTIIVMAVVGPLGLIVNSVAMVRQERNRIAASFLAEDIVENFRAYRDSFVLACKNISYIYSEDKETIESADCNFGGTSIVVTKDILQTSGTNPRAIAWNLFLNTINNRLNDYIYLDKASFDLLTNINDRGVTTCGTLKYDTLYGNYNCLNGQASDFKRTTRITKISDTALRIEVDVYYTPKRFMKVVDYIYER